MSATVPGALEHAVSPRGGKVRCVSRDVVVGAPARWRQGLAWNVRHWHGGGAGDETKE